MNKKRFLEFFSKRKLNSNQENPVISRRMVFRKLWSDVLISIEEIKGHKHCSFKDLSTLDSEKFGELVPVLCQEYLLEVENNFLIAVRKDMGEKRTVFEIKRENTEIFNHINGFNSVNEITAAASRIFDWSKKNSEDHVREMIKNLVSLNILKFKNPIED